MTRSGLITGATFVCVLLAVPNLARADGKIEIMGKYQCKGKDIDGKEYTGTVEIKKRGDTYTVRWSLPLFWEYEGVGVRTDNMLSVAWLSGVNAGVMVYQIEKGPKLTGRWAPTRRQANSAERSFDGREIAGQPR